MKYKIVATDLDGTLLTSDKSITKKTIKEIERIRKLGYIVVAVTARNMGSIKNVCDIEIFDYLILNNGVNIVDVRNNKIESLSYISKEVYKQITDDVKNDSIEIDYSSLNYYYVLDNKKTTMGIVRKPIYNIDDIKEEVSRMNVFFEGEVLLKKYKKELSLKYEDINVFEMQDANIKYRWLVLNPSKINKASTLKYLAKKLNIEMNEVIFFGDSLNDIEVIKSVGLGVAMKNAVEEVKLIAKEETASNDDEGVSKFLFNNLK